MDATHASLIHSDFVEFKYLQLLVGNRERKPVKGFVGVTSVVVKQVLKEEILLANEGEKSLAKHLFVFP